MLQQNRKNIYIYSYLKNFTMKEKENSKTVIELDEKGPIKITGDFTIVGYPILTKTASFCRCGKTSSPPFCSGAHDLNPPV
jgi:CDGSH-type Zn-finger protein